MVVDRLLVKPGIEKRLEASIETATKLANGLVLIAVVNGEERLYSQKLACTECGASIPQLEPRSFSFNSPYGACEECHGLGSTWTFDPAKVIADPSKPLLDGGLGPGAGSWSHAAGTGSARAAREDRSEDAVRELPKQARAVLLGGTGGVPGILGILQQAYDNSVESYREWLTEYMSPVECPACDGTRLRPASLAVQVKNFSIAEFTSLPVARALVTVRNWEFGEREMQIAGRVLDEIRRRLEFLSAVGLDYLSLERSAATLSGGEAQRIRLATQIGSKLRGVLYVLDEPSIGLHPRDNGRLLETLAHLRDMGNTVLVVEHDAETIERADYVIDLGPGAGRLGGETGGRGRSGGHRAQSAVAHRPIPFGRAGDSRAAGAADARRQPVAHPRRPPAQPEEPRRRHPAGRADRGHGRFRQRQIDAGERDSLPLAGARDLRLARGTGRRTTPSRA